MSWVDCVCDNDYEINTEYPYNIRRKGSDKIINESIHKPTGYIRCSLNRKNYLKHRIVALQFIPNDDPENKTEIDHRDHDRTNYHIENLVWKTRSDNQKNISGYGKKYVFIDELPTTAKPLLKYNNHELKDVFVDYENKKLYLFNTDKYREIIPHHDRGFMYYTITTNRKTAKISHKTLF